jgi:hypothetical protein
MTPMSTPGRTAGGPPAAVAGVAAAACGAPDCRFVFLRRLRLTVSQIFSRDASNDSATTGFVYTCRSSENGADGSAHQMAIMFVVAQLR